MQSLMDEKINWIWSNIFNKDKKINPRSSSRSWWQNKQQAELYDEIQQWCAFLPKSATYVEKIYCYVNRIQQIPSCKTCQGLVKFQRTTKNYAQYCSPTCVGTSREIQQKKEETSNQKYGYVKNFSSEQHKQQVQTTVLKKYGVINYAQHEDFIKQSYATQKEKYGDFYVRTQDYQDKKSKTCKEKYAVDHWMCLDEYKQKTQEINKKITPAIMRSITEKYLSGMPKQDLAIEVGFSISHLNKLLKSAGLETDLPQNKINYHKNWISSGEKEIRQVLGQDRSLVFNDRRLIWPYEIDIVDYDRKIAVEYNGTYWHSDFFKDRLYHKTKLEQLEQMGFRLITIFENVYRDKKQILISKLRSLEFGSILYARTLIIEECEYSQVKDFLEENHIQGTRTSAINFRALDQQGQIRAVATFNSFRDGLELVRLASNVKIPGILPKILKHLNNQHIYSFANRCYTYRHSNVYLHSGFKEISITDPNYYYVKGGNTISRNSAMKHKLPDLLQDFDTHLSEYENMINHGYHRFWDCGNLLYKRSM